MTNIWSTSVVDIFGNPNDQPPFGIVGGYFNRITCFSW